ncbi:sel1 repeat family protein [Chitinophaga pendula]|uniref:sel1 repeat family protein n=1 Tax=Chitinophaga TaxID=79328 RepID=UPI000BAE83FD|nr:MULTISPECIES: sel1 repeat family protein [Chitinophaga]ASZ14635.1 hypothetical protein CK934_28610 [Chitinophaga sp. MD30]UCJ07714.1 sel1 repeat family protein [Chitinophaga pendula]
MRTLRKSRNPLTYRSFFSTLVLILSFFGSLYAQQAADSSKGADLYDKARKVLYPADGGEGRYEAYALLLRQSAAAGYSRALYDMARHFSDGGPCGDYTTRVDCAFKEDKDSARLLYRVLAAAGYVPAQEQVISYSSYYDDPALDEAANDSVRFLWCVACADKGSPLCLSRLAVLYESGIGTAVSQEKSLEAIKRTGGLDFDQYENMDDTKGVIMYSRLELAYRYQVADSIDKTLFRSETREIRPIPIDYFESYVWCLLCNENKRHYIDGFDLQDLLFKLTRQAASHLSAAEQQAAVARAGAIIKRPLKNMGKLYQKESWRD